MTNPNLIKEITRGEEDNTYLVDGELLQAVDSVWLLIKSREAAAFPSPVAKYFHYCDSLHGEENAFEAILPKHLSQEFLEKTYYHREAQLIDNEFYHITHCVDFDYMPFTITRKLPPYTPPAGYTVDSSEVVQETSQDPGA